MRARTGDDVWAILRPPLDALDEDRARELVARLGPRRARGRDPRAIAGADHRSREVRGHDPLGVRHAAFPHRLEPYLHERLWINPGGFVEERGEDLHGLDAEGQVVVVRIDAEALDRHIREDGWGRGPYEAGEFVLRAPGVVVTVKYVAGVPGRPLPRAGRADPAHARRTGAWSGPSTAAAARSATTTTAATWSRSTSTMISTGRSGRGSMARELAHRRHRRADRRTRRRAVQGRRPGPSPGAAIRRVARRAIAGVRRRGRRVHRGGLAGARSRTARRRPDRRGSRRRRAPAAHLRLERRAHHHGRSRRGGLP